MVNGIVNEELEPLVEICLLFHGKVFKTKAVIDTGFNGYISVPLLLIRDSSWIFVGYEKFEIATGEIVEEKVFLGNVLFNDEVRKVGAIASRAKEVLIGTRLLADKIVEINFLKKRLTVEKAF
ncbi:MAG: hypothetical protein QME05_05115 [Candidatus Margulisbacteria bacterium]|nr:hypothetical protein [Candidatus Margulisiibacteriota bacterium]